MSEEIVIYVCKRCTASAGESGKCEFCGGEKVACRPGDDGDPIRKPLIDAQGNVVTRAPIWWLKHTVPQLIDDAE
ncbi:MAG: hypothetical protein QGM45_03250 [Anaerolineales bacterium]|nr:hypothetical protein [Anaerolineales bacterium]